MGKMLILKSVTFAIGGAGDDEEENTGGNNTGGNNTGGGTTGDDNTGGDNTGGDNTGGDNTGGDNTGGDNTGGDNTGNEPEENTGIYATYYFHYNGSDGRWYKNKADALAQGAINTVSFFVALGSSNTLTATLEPFGGGYARIISVNAEYDVDILTYSGISWGDTTTTSGTDSVSLTIASPRKSLWIVLQSSPASEQQGSFTEDQVQYIEDNILSHITLERT